MHQFRAEAAELVGQPRDPAHLHQVARLPDRGAAACRAATRQAAMRAMFLRHHRGDGVAFAVRACIEHDSGCIPVHDRNRLAGFARCGDQGYSQWNPCAMTPSYGTEATQHDAQQPAEIGPLVCRHSVHPTLDPLLTASRLRRRSRPCPAASGSRRDARRPSASACSTARSAPGSAVVAAAICSNTATRLSMSEGYRPLPPGSSVSGIRNAFADTYRDR